DLLVTGPLEDDVELGLLLGLLLGRAAPAPATGRGHPHRHRSGGLDPELLLDPLGQVCCLDDRQLLDGVEDVIDGELRHVPFLPDRQACAGASPPASGWLGAGSCSFTSVPSRGPSAVAAEAASAGTACRPRSAIANAMRDKGARSR